MFISAAALVIRQTVAQPDPGRDASRDFAMSHDRDASLRREMFSHMACSQCHSVDGSANKDGPILSAIGDKFTRNELIRRGTTRT